VLSAYLCRVITERQDGVCLLAQCVVNVSKIEHYGGVTAASFVPSQTKTLRSQHFPRNQKCHHPFKAMQVTRSMDAQLQSMLLAKAFACT